MEKPVYTLVIITEVMEVEIPCFTLEEVNAKAEKYRCKFGDKTEISITPYKQ